VRIALPTLISIAESSFLMGSDDGPDNERPIRRVRVDRFAIGACQVTNAEYALFLRATGHPPPPTWGHANFEDPSQPVVSVSWFDAVAYCDWLCGVTSRCIRLPFEAEWECAARGGAEQMLYPWGNDPPQSRQNYRTRWLVGPEPVGTSAPNAFGIYDMCENVHEWCRDWYAPYDVASNQNPQGPETGVRRASRGGSWRHQVKISRCAARSSILAEFQYADYGFRVCCDEP
jgi:formylglycine-generating enzyme required for sulfatase activity